MRFAEPIWLWLFAALPAFVLGSLWAARRRRRAVERFAGGTTFASGFASEVSSHRRAVKLLLVVLALVGLTLALARPQWGARAEPVTRRGSDVLLVLDTSLSMAAEDVAPSRLRLARDALGRLVDRLEGDRIGLVTFAGEATLACPLTVDRSAVRLFLEAQDVQAVAVAGTALAEALVLAERALAGQSAGDAERGRAIVVVSDGEDHAGELDDAIARLGRSGITVHAVGCGTVRGAPIPLREASGALDGYKKDREGKVVTTRLDEALLERLALETGGRYYRATVAGPEIDEIARALGEQTQGEIGVVLQTRYEERFQFPLLVAWLALALEAILGERRRPARRSARELT